MKRIGAFLFLILLFGPAGAVWAFTGLMLPFYGNTAPELSTLEQWIAQGEHEKAALGLSFYILMRGDEPEAGRAFTLMGMALLNWGKPEEAGAAFEKASQTDALLADVAARYQVKALEQAGKSEQALATLEECGRRFPQTAHLRSAIETRARLLESLGRHGQSAATYLELAAVPNNVSDFAKYRLAAAEAFLLAKDAPAARKAIRPVVFDAPPGRFTAAAVQLYALINKTMDEKLFATALAWYEDKAYRQAVPVLRELVAQRVGEKASPEMIHELKGKLAYALFRIHANEESLALYDELIADRTAEDRPHSLFRKAKILTRMGDNEASQKVFDQILKEHKASGYVRPARYQLALIDMEDNRYEKAYRYFKWRITKPVSNKEYLTWLAAWCAYRSGHLDTAQGYFEQLIKSYKKSRDLPRYRFWRGRIRALKKDEKGAVEAFRAINASRPLSYYGIKAHLELTARKQASRTGESILLREIKGGPALPTLFAQQIEPSDARRLDRIRSMTGAGMQVEAVDEILDLSAAYTEEAPVLFGLAGLLTQNGAHYSAMRLARKGSLYSFCKSHAGNMGGCYYSLIYPRGFSHLVEPYAKKRNLPTELVYALIHQESSFRPAVVSPAHAIGLMQIVPRTGAQIAREMGLEAFREDDLYDPITNVRFGTWYLRRMLDRFNGRLPFAIASYNAGPDVVEKWSRNKGELPEELFIEEIPYRETNTYVKKVSTNILIYKTLYNL